MTWEEKAACRDRVDLTWFPVNRGGRGGQTREYRQAIRDAIAVCHTCPVLEECRVAGMNEQGIWAGELHDSHVARPREVSPCGTTGAYRRHWRKGEPPCEPCRVAMQDAQKLRRDDQRARASQRVRDMFGEAS